MTAWVGVVETGLYAFLNWIFFVEVWHLEMVMKH